MFNKFTLLFITLSLHSFGQTPMIELSSSNLPIISIQTNDQEIVDEPRISAHMGIINNKQGRNYITDDYNDYDGNISIEIRGHSSQLYPKKNYSLETQKADSTNRNVSLLGMPKENDWVLHGPFADKSLMRNMLTYDYVRKMGRYAPRTVACELEINNEYRGVYVLTERIKRDDKRVDIAKIGANDNSGDDITGGYILQINRPNDDAANGFYSEYQSFVYYVLDDPKAHKLTPEQNTYISNYIHSFEDLVKQENDLESFKEYLDIPSLIDYVLATEITNHIDAYLYSFFMYKKKDSKGGKLHLGPIWDLNFGYGNFDFICDNSWEGWAYDRHMDCANFAFWLHKIIKLPEVQQQMEDRWMELRDDVWSDSIFENTIDSLANLLSESQVRNFEKFNTLGTYVWPNSFIGNTYAEEVEHLKFWVLQRLDWMDNNMNASGTSTLDGSTDKYIQITPNPNNGYVRISNLDLNISNTLRIYSITGSLIKEYNNVDNEQLIDLEDPGIYLYEIVCKNTICARGKIIYNKL